MIALLRQGAEQSELWLARQNWQPRRWLAVFAVVLGLQISPWWVPTPDAAAYLSMARSVSQGGAMTNLGSSHLWFPPGYPLLIAPAFWCGERPFLAISILHWVYAVLFMVGVYLWARKQVPHAAVLVTGLAVVNLGFWIHQRRSLSEIPFMCAMIYTVLGLDLVRRREQGRRALWLALAAGLAAAMAATIRHAGMLLPWGLAAALAWDARLMRITWRRAGVLSAAAMLPSLLVVAGLMQFEAHTAAQVGGTTHSHFFSGDEVGVAANLLEGLRLRIGDVGQVLVPGMLKSYAPAFRWWNLNNLIYLAIGVAVLRGWWHFALQRQEPWVLALPFYLALHVAYGQEAGARFLVPMIGLLAGCLWYSMFRWAPVRNTLLAMLLVGHFAAALGYTLAWEIPRSRELASRWAEVDALAAQLRTTGRACAVIDDQDNLRCMLELALDRPSVRYDNSAALPDQVTAVVLRSDRDDSPALEAAGFVPSQQTAELTLWTRPHLAARP